MRNAKLYLDGLYLTLHNLGPMIALAHEEKDAAAIDLLTRVRDAIFAARDAFLHGEGDPIFEKAIDRLILDHENRD
jgi:microcystin degradation protein MlrC